MRVVDGSAWRDEAPADAERKATARLDEHGSRLYRYLWLMLGDDLTATRALTDTVIAAFRNGSSACVALPI